MVNTPNQSGTGYYVTGRYPISGARYQFTLSVRSVNVFGDESTTGTSASCYVP